MGALGLVALVPLVTRAQNNSSIIAMPGGSFESPIYDRAPFYGYGPGYSEWTWSGFAGIQRNGSGLGAANAPAGAQTALLQGSGTAGQQGAFSQKVALAAGTYRVTFKAAKRATGNGVPIQIKMDGTALGAPITPVNTTFADYASQPFVVSAGSSDKFYRLGFGTDSNSGVSMSLIDSIAIEAMPSLVNGSFEAPIYDRAPFHGYYPANSGWTWSGQAGIGRNGGLGANAPEGVQTAFLQGASQPGAFAQPVTLPAGNYKVVFKAAQRSSNSVTPIQVSINGNPIGAPITPSSPAFAAYSTTAFNVNSAGNYSLAFSTTSVGGGAYSLIDDIRVENIASSPVVLPAALVPASPTNLAASAKTGRVILTWTASSGALGYKLKRATAAAGPFEVLAPDVPGPTYTDGTVSNGTTYFYRVYAYDAMNNSDDSNQVVATPLAAPVVTAISGVGRIDLSWNPIAGATSYQVRPLNGTSDLQNNGTTASQNTLASGTEYDYNVVAYAANGSSDPTYVRKVTLADAPQLAISGNFNPSPSLSLSWNSVVSATSYRLKRSTSQGGPYVTLPNVLTGTSFDDTGLSPETTYYYRIYAINAGGNSPDSQEVTGRTRQVPPASAPVLSATGSSPTSGVANLSWSAVANASYRIERRFGASGNFAPIAATAGTTYVDSGLTYGVTYSYRVYATNNVGDSPSSNVVDVRFAPTAPTPTPTAAPTATPVPTAVPTPVPTPVPTATPVAVDNFVRQGGFEMPNLPAASYRYTNVVGSEWTFDHSSGLASNGSAFSNATAPEGVQVAFVQATGSLRQTVTFSAGTYALRFQAAARDGLADDYAIKIDGVTIDTLTQSNNAYSGYQQVTSSAFTVTAGAHEIQFAGLNNVDRTVLLDDVQTVTAAPPPPSVPTNLQAVAGNAQITLNWGASNGAASYKVKRSTTNGGPYTTLAPSVPSNSYTDTGLANGTTFYYRVYAVNVGGNSPDSNQAQATPVAPPTAPTAPSGFTATAVNTQIRLSWNAVNGATSYKIFRSTTSGTYNYATPLVTTTATFYDDGSVVNGTTYFYVVRAVSATGESVNSIQQSAMLSVPPGLRFELTNPAEGATLSGLVGVRMIVYDPNIEVDDRWELKVDGVVHSTPALSVTSESSGVKSNLDTRYFANGSHVIVLTNGTDVAATRNVIFSNTVSQLRYKSLFDATGSLAMVSTTSTITAAIAANTPWTLSLTDAEDNVVRSFTGMGNGTATSINVIWNGKNDSGVQVPFGNYMIYVSVGASADSPAFSPPRDNYEIAPPSGPSAHLTSYKPRARFYLTQTNNSFGRDPKEIVGIINFVTESDCLILLSTEVLEGDDDALMYAAAVGYSTYIRTCMLAGGSMSIDATRVVPIIVSDAQANSDPGLVPLINHRFSRPLALSYVFAHGNSSPVPRFKLGRYRWFSNDIVNSSDTRISVRELMRDAGLSYGDETDEVPPPRLVWMDHCSSAGQGISKLPGEPTIADTDLSWAGCFGIAPEMTQGVFLGWSGSVFIYGQLSTPASTVWRIKMWYFTLVDKRNIGVTLDNTLNIPIFNTAISRADFLTRQDEPIPDYPYDIIEAHRAYGQWRTSF